jgi:hypothetical protein
MEVCWSCGTSAAGEADPHFVSAADAAPIPLEPILDPEADPKPELDDELPGPPPEFVLAYETGDEAMAQFLTDQLCSEGIRALKTREVCAISTRTVGQVQVHTDDLPRAQTWLVEFERHRQDRQRRRVRHRSSDEMWGALLLAGYLAVFPCALLGTGCYAVIAYLAPDGPLARIVGIASGLALFVFLLSWLYRARKRAAASKEPRR